MLFFPLPALLLALKQEDPGGFDFFGSIVGRRAPARRVLREAALKQLADAEERYYGGTLLGAESAESSRIDTGGAEDVTDSESPPRMTASVDSMSRRAAVATAERSC